MFGHILIATDGSEFSEKAVFEGAKLAKALGSKVTVVTAVQVEAPHIVDGKIIGPSLDERRKSAQSKANGVLDAAKESDSSSSSLPRMPETRLTSLLWLLLSV